MKTVGRKASISSEDIINAAIALVGPHRSISSLSLREVTREAGIAPNSFYRHFKDMETLNIAIIELAGKHLRTIIRDARILIINEKSVVRVSVECFFNEMTKPGPRDEGVVAHADDRLAHLGPRLRPCATP